MRDLDLVPFFVSGAAESSGSGAGVTVWTHSCGRPQSAEDCLQGKRETGGWWGSGRKRRPTKLGKGARLLQRSGAGQWRGVSAEGAPVE